MADTTNLIEMPKIQHKEQMEKPTKQHAEQMTVLRDQVKTKEIEIKHLIEAAHDEAKGSSTTVHHGQFPSI